MKKNIYYLITVSIVVLSISILLLDIGARTSYAYSNHVSNDISVTDNLKQKNTYYISSAGSDRNNGTSEASPWRSLDKVSQHRFSPGDRILFKRCDTWSNKTLNINSSGTKNNPITIGAYGEGEIPKLMGNAKVSDVISIYNQQYIKIENLDISNKVKGFTGKDDGENGVNGKNLGDFRGIHVLGENKGDLSGFNFNHLKIHDVDGQVAWIWGTGRNKNGVLPHQGWNGSKRTGAIVMEVMKGNEDANKEFTPTIFHNIRITNNEFKNNSFGCVIIKQTEKYGERKGGEAPDYWSKNMRLHTDIDIKDNYIDAANNDWACSPIYIVSGKKIRVERNVVNGSGADGIEVFTCDQACIQHNEIYGVVKKLSSADNNGIDCDTKSTNILVQYNLVHDCGAGYLFCANGSGSAVFRYNIASNVKRSYFDQSSSGGSVYVYNNLFYNPARNNSNVKMFESYAKGSSKTAETYIYNNIFYNENKITKLKFDRNIHEHFDYNSYYGVDSNLQDNHKITKNPNFSNDFKTPNGNEKSGPKLNAEAVRPKGDSPLINAGVCVVLDGKQLNLNKITDNHLDYSGCSINLLNPYIGIFDNHITGLSTENCTKK